MTDASNETTDEARMEAVQAVLDRITSYQESATEGTTDVELREALSETDLQLDEGQIEKLVQAVETTDGPVKATDVLG